MRKIFMRRVMPVLAAVATLTGAGAAMGTSSASAAGYGGFVYTGTASLPLFPCGVFPPVLNNPCTGGTFTGSAVGVAADTDDSAVVCTACTLTASFSYDEACPLTAGFPPLGSASGTFAVRQPGSGALVVSGTFQWARVGLTAVLVLTVTADAGGAATGAGGSAAVFLPNTPLPPHDCSNPGPQGALVVGAAAALVVTS